MEMIEPAQEMVSGDINASLNISVEILMNTVYLWRARV